jgi:tRNA (cmo5U34)-methyltransferase
MISLAARLKGKDVRITGVDSSSAMLKQASERLDRAGLKGSCTLEKHELEKDFSMTDASAVFLVLTLQFVRPPNREAVIRRIYEALNPGGCLIFVEKILGADSATGRMYIDFYHDFKKRNGYSDLEIAGKREALENVLIPYTAAENISLLRQSGFPVVDTFFQWYNFAGFVAVK